MATTMYWLISLIILISEKEKVAVFVYFMYLIVLDAIRTDKKHYLDAYSITPSYIRQLIS